MYYKLYQNNQRKIPGVVVLVIIALFVSSLVYILKDEGTVEVVKQDASVLERVDTANVRDKSATIFWRTNDKTQGYVVYGPSPDQLIYKAYDDRDVSTNPLMRQNHIVQISNLKQDATTYYQIVVNDNPLGQSAEMPFTLETERQLTSPLDLEPLYGEVRRVDRTAEVDAIVIAHIGGARPIIARTSNDGSFLLSPCCLYSSQSGEPMYPSKDDLVRVEIIAEDGTSKIIQSKLGDMSPLAEALIIDADDDIFADGSNDPSEPSVLAASGSLIKLDPVDIIYPKENAYIPGTRPLIRGVGEPGTRVKGTFPTMDRIFQITVDEDRNWIYEPSFDFKPGPHEISIEAADEFGKVLTLSRSFTILKSGEAVLGEATPSGTITPSATATPEPTLILEPTVIATSTPTPPVSGFNILPFTIISLVLIVIGAGVILVF